MRHITLVSAIAAAGIVLAGCDQNTASTQQAPTSTAQGTSNPVIQGDPGLRTSIAQLSNESMEFVNKAAMGDKFEIDASKIALERSEFADVKEFAQKMIDDHTKNADDLKSAIMQSGMTTETIPADLDMDHQAMIDALNNASDQEFDRRYIDQQADAHTNALSLMQDYAKSGDNPELRAFAEMSEPMIQMHLNQVKIVETTHNRRAANP